MCRQAALPTAPHRRRGRRALMHCLPEWRLKAMLLSLVPLLKLCPRSKLRPQPLPNRCSLNRRAAHRQKVRLLRLLPTPSEPGDSQTRSSAI